MERDEFLKDIIEFVRQCKGALWVWLFGTAKVDAPEEWVQVEL